MMRRALKRASTYHQPPEEDKGASSTKGSGVGGGHKSHKDKLPQDDLPSSSSYAQGEVKAGTTNDGDKVVNGVDGIIPSISTISEPAHAKDKVFIKKSQNPKKRDRSQSKNLPIPPLASSSSPSPETPPSAIRNATARTNISKTNILEKVATAYSKPVEQTPMSCDLPRLISRIVVQDGREGRTEEYTPDEGKSSWSLVNVLMMKLAEMVGDKEALDVIQRLIEEKQDNQNTSEIRLWVDHLVKAINPNNKIISICKLINQNIIMPLATQIKVVIFSLTNTFTKDVRTADGWRIFIKFLDNDTVLCSHIKKETSITSDSNSFEFEWHLNIYLNIEKQIIDKIDIVFTKLWCHDNILPEMKKKLTDAMNLIVEG